MTRWFAMPVLTLLTASPSLHAQVRPDKNYDWMESIWFAYLFNHIGFPLISDHFETYKYNFCTAEGQLYLVELGRLQVGSGSLGLPHPAATTTLAGSCKPSDDGHGNPLPWLHSKRSPELGNILPLIGGTDPSSPGPASRAAQQASTNGGTQFILRAPFRELPFAPIYPASVPRSPLPCDPNNNATALVVNHGSGSVTRVTGCTDQTIAVIPVVSNPLQVDFTQDGSLALVTSYDSAISFIDLATNTVVKTLTTDPSVHPGGIAITPDGSRAYVTNFFLFNPSVLVVDIASRSIVSTISLGTPYPQSAFLSPDGSTLWVTHSLNNAITLIDTLSATAVAQLSILTPYGVAFNATGTQAFVTSGTSPGGAVMVLDTATYGLIKIIPVGNGPVDLAMLPDDSTLMVGNFFGQSISVIDPKTFAVQTFPLGGSPMGLAIVQ
jgi:DNA-binding beta-propeller fold protein YncE